MSGKNVLLGVSGSIAAYKSPQIVTGLIAEGCTVRVVFTQNAPHFIPSLPFKGAGAEACFHYTFNPGLSDFENNVAIHVELAQWADVFLIAPATANIIGKFANGIADDLLSSIHLAVPKGCKKIMYPAMNPNMLNHPAVQHNMKTLRFRGWDIQAPEEGRLACGKTGMGKMPKPRTIVEYVQAVMGGKTDIGKPLYPKIPSEFEVLHEYIADMEHCHH